MPLWFFHFFFLLGVLCILCTYIWSSVTYYNTNNFSFPRQKPAEIPELQALRNTRPHPRLVLPDCQG